MQPKSSLILEMEVGHWLKMSALVNLLSQGAAFRRKHV
jgi:hypothetical protein